jgi:hypothetical protein
VLTDELLHHLAHLLRANVAIDMQFMGFARVFIHHAQHPIIDGRTAQILSLRVGQKLEAGQNHSLGGPRGRIPQGK